MSDLQISLIVIGVTIIGGVVLYNWVQERNFRKRLDQAFGAAPDDVLLPREAQAGQGPARTEPHLQPDAAAAPLPRAVRSEAGTAPSIRQQPPGRDGDLECVAEIEAGTVIAEAALEQLLARVAECGRPTRVHGLNAETGTWEEVGRGAGGRYRGLQLALQLVNRAGTVNAAQL